MTDGGGGSPPPGDGGWPVVFPADCPTRPVLDQIADKWSLLVMGVLEEPRRFNEIRRRLDGVSQRVLTQTLRRLERSGMVVRTVLPTSPVGVVYSLTPLGQSLRQPFEHLYRWAEENAPRIREHQVAYDSRPV